MTSEQAMPVVANLISVLVMAFYGGRLTQKLDDLKAAFDKHVVKVDKIDDRTVANTSNIQLVAQRTNTPLPYSK